MQKPQSLGTRRAETVKVGVDEGDGIAFLVCDGKVDGITVVVCWYLLGADPQDLGIGFLRVEELCSFGEVLL